MSAISTANRTIRNPVIKDVVTFLETYNETNGSHTLALLVIGAIPTCQGFTNGSGR